MISAQKVSKQLFNQVPFSFLDEGNSTRLFANASLIRYKAGQVIVRPDELPRYISIVIDGSIRMLASSVEDNEPITIDKRGKGQIIGWISLLRGQSSEWAIASEESILLTFPSEEFVNVMKSCDEFAASFYELPNLHETYDILKTCVQSSISLPKDWELDLATFESICSHFITR